MQKNLQVSKKCMCAWNVLLTYDINGMLKIGLEQCSNEDF